MDIVCLYCPHERYKLRDVNSAVWGGKERCRYVRWDGEKMLSSVASVQTDRNRKYNSECDVLVRNMRAGIFLWSFGCLGFRVPEASLCTKLTKKCRNHPEVAKSKKKKKIVEHTLGWLH